ncbi:MAG: hypothetical protein LAQ69_51550, partial [Acidobacteriia bacterium]|nr:hypothetical protein [Terriglobia bacterium]
MQRRKASTIFSLFALISSLLMSIAGCGGAKTTTAASPPVPAVTLSISPANVRVGLGSGMDFYADRKS